MILPFSTKFKDGTPTHFVEKIWSCLVNVLRPIRSKDPFYESDLNTIKERAKYNLNIYEASKLAPKLHSIREDVHDRWHAGRLIHPVINNRSKNQFQFAPEFPCISTQKIEIFRKDTLTFLKVDGRFLNISEVTKLAENDGFNSVDHFFSWFDHDFTGKIIHWTNLQY